MTDLDALEIVWALAERLPDDARTDEMREAFKTVRDMIDRQTLREGGA